MQHPTLQVLAFGEARSFFATRLFGVMGRTLLHAAVAWHVWDLTRDELWLGVLGLVEFLPVIPVALVGGSLADTRDRRDVSLLTHAATAAAAAALAWGGANTSLALILLALFVVRAAWAFQFPAMEALLPTLVPREIFQSAVVVGAMVRNVAFITGPVVGGFLIDARGVETAYALAAVLLGVATLCLVPIERRAVGAAPGTRVGVAAVREGIAFVRSRPAILAAMALDMVAVILADPTVLLAVYADRILGVGAQGYGLLYAAMAIGTFAATVPLLFRRSFGRPGVALLVSVLGFGLATVVFGASHSFPLSVAALVCAGIADQVSQVARSSIIQLSTPDALRGRVNAVNMVFISASNQFGASFSGFLAAATSTFFAVVGGGVGCLLTVAAVAVRAPSLRRWRPDAAEAQSEGSPNRSR